MLYMIRKFCLVGCALICIQLSAQVPYIKSVDFNSAKSQQTITLQGINFGTNASNIKVVFGSVTATPQAISDQLIEVVVPNGTSFDNIGVANTSTGVVGNYKDPFLQSFGGTNPFNPAAISSQFDFNAQSGLYDLAVADFDGDGKPDIVTAIDNSLTSATPNPVDFFLNTSTPGAFSFTRTSLSPGVITLHVFATDLNGDAKPEILLSEKNGSRIFIYKNNSTPGTPSFALQTLTLTGSKVAQVRAKDMDLNGKTDLVVTDQSTGKVFVVPNNSTFATIQFGTPVSITLNGSSGVDGIEVADLNGDGLQDIIASEFLTPTGNTSIVQNLSSPGSFVFNTPQLIQAGTTVSNLRVGDLNADGKPDLAATALLGSGVLVYKNQSSGSSIQLASPVLFDANARPWGIDFGDADGDGKTDIMVASVTDKSVTILNNQSSSGNFTFTKNTLTTTYINRFPKIVDIDGDGRPDFVFTSIDDNNLGVPSSKISIIRNLNCVVPSISPTGPITVCSGLTQRLTASANSGGMYQWIKDGTPLGAASTTNFLDVTATGSYTVSLTNASCTQTSSAVQVNVVSASSLSTATPTPVTPVCLNGTLNLSVNNVGATDYVWTGPQGFSANGLNVSRTNFQSNQAGVYNLEVMIGSCVTQRAEVIVDVVDVPGIQVISSGSDLICQGQTKLLSLYPTVTGYTYQWSEQTSGAISGATSSTYSAGATGSYLISLKSTVNASCAPIQSATKSVRVVQLPVVNFSLPANGCVGQTVNLADQSTLDPDISGLTINYAWDFGDASTGSGSTVTHTFSAAQTFNVKLTVSYDNQTCPVSLTKFLPVKALPSATITSSTGLFSFCPSSSLDLSVATGFDSYLWSTGGTTNSITVSQQGTYSVDISKGGCTATFSKAINQFPAPIVTVAADPNSINKGSTSKLTASGLSTYIWTPGKSLSPDSISAEVVAKPVETTNYTVTGKDANGCSGQAAIAVIVIPDHAINSLIPSAYFSPNGDTINDTWTVENAPTLSQCSVLIFDEHGFKVFEAKPYLNNWNGVSAKGSVLPAGVYYYVMKCDDSPADFKAGSINIVR